MASKVMRVIITGDVKGAVKSFAELDLAAGKTDMSMSQRFQSLGKYVGVAMAAGAVAAGVALFKLGDTFDGVYDRIRTNTGATGKSLEGLKDDFRAVVATVPTDFNSAGNAITLLNQKLGLTGAPLQNLAGQFLNVSRITKTDLTENLKAGTDMLNAFGIKGKEQNVVLDQMFRAAQKSGLSFTDMLTRVRDAGIQLRGLGLSASQAAALVATLGKAGIDSAEALPGLNKALAEAAKAGVPANEFFGNFINTIKNAPDATTAAGIAVDVLGSKSGPKFAQLVREGKLSYDDMLGSIVNGKDTIDKASKQTEDFAEKWTQFKNQALLALEPVATRVFDIVGKGMDYLASHKPMLIAVSALIGTVLVAAFAAWAISAATAAAATLAAAAPVIAIGAAIAALIAAAVLLYTKWDEVWSWIRDHPAVAAVIALITGPVTIPIFLLVGAIKFLQANWDTIWPAIQGTLQVVWSVLSVIFSALDTAIRKVIDVATWLGGIAGAVFGAFSSAVQVMWGIVSFYFNAVVSVVTAIINVATWLGGIAGSAFGTFASAVQTMWNLVQPPLNFIYNRLQDIISAARAVKNALGAISGAVGGAIGAVGDVLGLASGGPVAAGTPYIVGEQGPELFVPSVAGQIIPNDVAMGTGGRAFGPTTITIPITLDGRVVTEVVVSNLNRAGGPKILQRAVI